MTVFKPPAFYNFPPFWTLQDVMDTRRRQCGMWCELILNYCKAKKLTHLVVADELSKPGGLFKNESIERQLTTESAVFFLDQLVAVENAHWTDNKKEIVRIITRRPAEWVTVFRQWVESKGVNGLVFTYFDLREGEETARTMFHMMDKDDMRKTIKLMAEQKLAEIVADVEDFDECGVKFTV